jgi:hypothetical protein
VEHVASNVVNCTFDYLDARDGGVIELLNTDKKTYPKLEGSIRGIPKGLRDGGPVPLPRRERRWGVLLIGIGAFFLAGGVLWPEVFHAKLLPERFEKVLERMGPFILGLAFFAIGIGVLWATTPRLPEKLRGALE